jgi:hypothetical protein
VLADESGREVAVLECYFLLQVRVVRCVPATPSHSSSFSGWDHVQIVGEVPALLLHWRQGKSDGLNLVFLIPFLSSAPSVSSCVNPSVQDNAEQEVETLLWRKFERSLVTITHEEKEDLDLVWLLASCLPMVH